MRKASVIVAACVAAAYLVQPASASTGTVTTLCDNGARQLVYGTNGMAYQVRDAYWLGTRTMCITNRRLRPNFTVVKPPGADPAGRVSAYPDIYRGCLWHVCSPNARIPIQAKEIGRLQSTWHTRQDARGDWSAAYDLWFGKQEMITGQADGAELMIWLNRHGSCCHLSKRAPVVRISGYKFWLMHWHHFSRQWDVGWHYIQFRLVHPRRRVDDLRLKPFITKSIRLGLIRRSWWLENVTAGFEIWRGGKGLATTRFSVSLSRVR
jgi:cellulose 1,4-beta-cellobiosidase